MIKDCQGIYSDCHERDYLVYFEGKFFIYLKGYGVFDSCKEIIRNLVIWMKCLLGGSLFVWRV